MKNIAHELRIGNIHEGTDFSIPRLGMSSVKINGQSFNHIASYGIHLVDEGKMEFKPILLTEEWLVEFGLIKTSDENHYEKEYKLDDFYLRENKLTGTFYYGETELKYVHHLQNLFYELKRTELKLSKVKVN